MLTNRISTGRTRASASCHGRVTGAGRGRSTARSALVVNPPVDVPLGELDPAAEIVVYCHTGVRSAHATAFLRSHGLRARNLVGGINAWSLRVDPSVPRY